jgi:hypothetical protein
MSESKNDYVQRQTGNSKAWNSEIILLQAHADRATGKKVDRYRLYIKELTTLRDGLDEKVSEIQKSGEAGWEELKAGADKSFKALDKSFKSAKAFFN